MFKKIHLKQYAIRSNAKNSCQIKSLFTKHLKADRLLHKNNLVQYFLSLYCECVCALLSYLFWLSHNTEMYKSTNNKLDVL
jgi:hypothetical protein